MNKIVLRDFFKKVMGYVCRPQFIFFVFVICFSIKTIIWHFQFFGDKEVEVLSHLSFPLLLFSGILLCKKRPYWTLIVLFITNIWLFANFVYERAWGKMLSMDMVRMVGNLRGFEDSVKLYYNSDMLWWLIIPDIICIFFLIIWKSTEKRSWLLFSIVIAIFVILIPIQNRWYYNTVYDRRAGYNNNEGFAHWWNIHEPSFNTFSYPGDAAHDGFMFQEPQNWERTYLHNYSAIYYAPAIYVYDYVYKKLEKQISSAIIELSPEQNEKMNHLTGSEPDFKPKRSLVVILVESLESWVVNYPLGNGYLMENMHKFIDSHNVFYASEMNCQVAYGGSSDGQLMLMTGLLPVRQGVTVALYGEQSFPNYAHYYSNSMTLNPSPGTWKQRIVNPNYGVKILEESDSIRDDAGIFHRLNSIDLSEPTFVLAITVSTHVPFSKADEVELTLDSDMPESMAKYLKCFYYFDQQLGTFFNRLENDSTLANTDIVITGDHTIFYTQDWLNMQNYASSKGIDALGSGINTTCMMLYSPEFTESNYYREPTYQMDLYPTILHMIGCERPAWKGVGMDLLGNEPREFSIYDAENLSDKLIRMKYFSGKSD